MNSFRTFLLALLIALVTVIYKLNLSETNAATKRSSVQYGINVPALGDTWYTGSSVNLSWTLNPSILVDTIQLDLYLNDSASVNALYHKDYMTSSMNLPGSATSFQYNVLNSLIASNGYVARLRGYKGGQLKWDVNSNYFTIASLPLSICGPLGMLYSGQVAMVNYYADANQLDRTTGLTATISDLQSADPVLKQGVLLTPMFGVSSGVLPFLIPYSLPRSKTYQLTIFGVALSNRAIIAYKTGFFTVSTPSLLINTNVTVPVSTKFGSSVLFKVSSLGAMQSLSSWSIALYSRDISSPYFYSPFLVASSISPLQSVYNWTSVNLVASESYYAYIFGAQPLSNTQLGVTSNDFNLVYAPSITDASSVASTIVTTFPKSGDNWVRGAQVTVNWAMVPQNTLQQVTSWNVDLYYVNSAGNQVYGYSIASQAAFLPLALTLVATKVPGFLPSLARAYTVVVWGTYKGSSNESVQISCSIGNISIVGSSVFYASVGDPSADNNAGSSRSFVRSSVSRTPISIALLMCAVVLGSSLVIFA